MKEEVFESSTVRTTSLLLRVLNIVRMRTNNSELKVIYDSHHEKFRRSDKNGYDKRGRL